MISGHIRLTGSIECESVLISGMPLGGPVSFGPVGIIRSTGIDGIVGGLPAAVLRFCAAGDAFNCASRLMMGRRGFLRGVSTWEGDCTPGD